MLVIVLILKDSLLNIFKQKKFHTQHFKKKINSIKIYVKLVNTKHVHIFFVYNNFSLQSSIVKSKIKIMFIFQK